MKAVLAVIVLFVWICSLAAYAAPPVRIGSKQFTESVILGEILRLMVESVGSRALHRAELGSTRILWNALLAGEIDVYPEYTGTLAHELLADEAIDSPEALRSALARRGLRMTAPLGFNNTYAIGMREDVASRLGIRSFSDLSRFPGLRIGLSNEFRSRADGWPRLQRIYHLPQKDVRGMDHDVAYRGLANGDIAAIDLYSTDAEIKQYGLRVLKDDLGVFPRYDAAILYRDELERRDPAAVHALRHLEGRISESEMIAMNARAKLERIPEAEVAGAFVRSRLGIHQISGHISGYMSGQAAGQGETVMQRILLRLGEHLGLVAKSMAGAILLGVPLGVLAARRRGFGQVILTIVGVIQTIPALALLVLLIRPLSQLGFSGIGDTPAIVALFLYSLLPIVRNTQAGICGIARPIRESAEALGLGSWARLRLIELPLATPLILAGIKTAAVINVGFATLGALIGAGGLGQPILTGIRLDQYGLILEGAVPAAALAILTQLLFEGIERWLVPRELRG